MASLGDAALVKEVLNEFVDRIFPFQRLYVSYGTYYWVL